jgi:hypothetical protein
MHQSVKQFITLVAKLVPCKATQVVYMGEEGSRSRLLHGPRRTRLGLSNIGND